VHFKDDVDSLKKPHIMKPKKEEGKEKRVIQTFEIYNQ
jgi:hypothetical protein